METGNEEDSGENQDLMEFLDKEMGEASSEEDIEAAEAEQESVENADSDGEPVEEPEEEVSSDVDSDAAPEIEEPETDDALRLEMKEKTGKRFDELRAEASELKTLKPEFEQIKQHYEGLTKTLRETGGTADEIGDALDYVAMVKSGNMAAVKAHLDQQIANYQQATGQKYDAPDPFANHPQLRSQVDNLETTPELALERVRLETAAKHLEDQKRQTEQAQQAQARHDQGYQAMAAAEQAVIAANRAAFTPQVANYIKGKIQEDMQVYPPEQWAQRYQNHYSDIILFQQVPAQPKPADPEPMRTSPASAGQRAPKTMEDAMLNAIAEANA